MLHHRPISLLLTFLILQSACGALKRRRLTRALIPSRTQRFSVYEGEQVTLNCTKDNQDTSGGQPYLVAIDTRGSQITTQLVTSRPNSYTVVSTITMTRDYNSKTLLKCQNGTYTNYEAWDHQFVFTVYYLDLKPGKDQPLNEVSVKDGGSRIDCRDWFDSNYNVEYRWTGNVVRSTQVAQSLASFFPDDNSGSHDAQCHATLQGDTKGYTSKTVKFRINFKDDGNLAWKMTSNPILSLLALTAIAFYY